MANFCVEILLFLLCLYCVLSEGVWNYEEMSGKLTSNLDTTPLFIITENGINRVNEVDKRNEIEESIRKFKSENPHFRRFTDSNDTDTDTQHAPSTGRASRSKRAENGRKTAVIEMIIVTDSTIYQRFLKQNNNNEQQTLKAIRLYYTLYVNMMDQWYGSFQSDDVIIRVQPIAVLVSTVASTSPFTEETKGENPQTKVPDEVNASTGLRAFTTWLKSSLSGFSLQYDHAMLFSDYSMYRGPGFATSGLSYVGQMCKLTQGWSASIMSEEGAFNGVYTSIHELTHNLGSDHDGEIDKSCKAQENMIMAPTNYFRKKVARNYFSFSRCTKNDVEKFFRGSGPSCLFDTARAPPPERGPTQAPGTLLTVDQQCKDILGPQSSACEGRKYEKQICYRLWCRNPVGHKCTTLGHTHAVYGTPCGANKWCKGGECVNKP